MAAIKHVNIKCKTNEGKKLITKVESLDIELDEVNNEFLFLLKKN